MAKEKKNENILFHTVMTTKRHRQHGYCEDSDYGMLRLISVPVSEKNLLIKFRTYSTEPLTELVEYNGMIFLKVNKDTNMHQSRKEDAQVLKMQGYFSEKSAVKLMLRIRDNFENTFSHIRSDIYLLIGKTLYSCYGKASNLVIKIDGNLLFSYWLSISIDVVHNSKGYIKATKSNLKKVIERERKRFDAGKPDPSKLKGNEHISFSCPTEVTWGKNYNS